MLVFQDSQISSPVKRLDPRCRILVAFAFAVIMAVSTKNAVLAVGAILVLPLPAFARLFPGRILKRLAELNFFMLFVLLFLPLSVPGTPVVEFGPWTWSRAGLIMAAVITAKANLIMIAVASLVGTMEPGTLGHGLRSLGMPEKLTRILFFMVRYIEVIFQEYRRLRSAMLLRGFQARCNLHTLQTFGYLIGMLLVRSLDRADNVACAMKCRGFSGRFYSHVSFRFNRYDVFFSGLGLVGILLLVFLEFGA
ncbi:MAG: cobalt ECF transporter T component CbiQ [Desulfobulbaceae bacterium]|nr:cobalt ECF transporter T component CbiQ [Desulfobulbaceae bacterium]